MENQKSTSIEDLKKAWRECPPSQVADLFFEENTGVGAPKRADGGYFLPVDGMNLLINPANKIQDIRIDLGCQNNNFVPIFTIIYKDRSGDKITSSFEMMKFSSPGPNEDKSSADKLNSLPSTPILKGMDRALTKKWRELSHAQISTAFSGVTCQDISSMTLPKYGDIINEDIQELNLYRVRSYGYKNVTKDIVKDLRQRARKNKESYIYLQLGAGLTYEITHPFLFRPILAVSSVTVVWDVDEQGRIIVENDEDGENYYERAQPCPPYCPNGEGL